ncbi:MAG: 3-deoxy-D-manno-octulosonic acid transferase [Myxococcales bacterium]|nr:3-deoxy-D-manno-octulosonic acid transferase [Myxococcales bacterium]
MASPSRIFWQILYNLVWIALPILLFPVILWKLREPKHRLNAIQRLGFLPRGLKEVVGKKRPIWLHAVSVGETRAAAPLVRAIKERFPDRVLVVSTVTVTGQETARQLLTHADYIFYMPFDLPWSSWWAVHVIHPLLFIHTETEIWPNVLTWFHLRGTPTLIVNGRISERSVRNYRLVGRFFRDVIAETAVCAMQSKADAERIVRAGARPERVVCTGNMKFELETKVADPEQLEALRRVLGIESSDRVIVAGSTHDGEEILLLDVFRAVARDHPEALLIIAPRHPERFDAVAAECRRAGVAVDRRSELGKHGQGRAARVVLLDSMGELLSVYRFAEFVFVGGSFAPRGGHNVLEAAALAKPVLYGPHMGNFADIARALEAAGAAVRVADAAELTQRMRALLDAAAEAEAMGRRGLEVVAANRGATQRNLELVERTLVAAEAAGSHP